MYNDCRLDQSLNFKSCHDNILEQVSSQEKLIEETVTREYLDEYYENIVELDNIVVDTENLYLDKNMAFPCLTLFDYINRHNKSKTKINIHFITKIAKNCSVIQEDIKGALNSPVFKGEYMLKRTGTIYKAEFVGLDEFIKNKVNIYFHKLGDEKNKDRDDIYLLYLLNRFDKVYYYSKDFKMIIDHVSDMKFNSTIPINVNIYKFNHVLSKNLMIRSLKITLKDIKLKKDFWSKYNYSRILI